MHAGRVDDVTDMLARAAREMAPTAAYANVHTTCTSELTSSLELVDYDVSHAHIESPPASAEATQVGGWYDVDDILHSVPPIDAAATLPSPQQQPQQPQPHDTASVNDNNNNNNNNKRVHASAATHTKPRKGARAPPKQHLMCDLCNAILFDDDDDDDVCDAPRSHGKGNVMQAHMMHEHRELLQELAANAHATTTATTTTTTTTTAAEACRAAHDDVDETTCSTPVDACRGIDDGDKDAATTADTEYALGQFMLQSVRDADGGPAMFAVIQNAQKQLCALLSTTMTVKPLVFLFGSCVSLGIWDGCGDADFSAVFYDLLEGSRRTPAVGVGAATAAAAAQDNNNNSNNNNNNNDNNNGDDCNNNNNDNGSSNDDDACDAHLGKDEHSDTHTPLVVDENDDDEGDHGTADDHDDDDDAAVAAATTRNAVQRDKDDNDNDDGEAAAVVTLSQPPPSTPAAAAAASPSSSSSAAAMAHAVAAALTMLSKSRENMLITEMARKLRSVGFHFDELELVLGARTPVLRRARAAKRPHVLRPPGEAYCVEVHIAHPGVRERYRARESAQVARTFAGVYMRGGNDARDEADRVEFANATDAMRFFRRRDGDQVRKRWRRSRRLPELFSVDFDLSCRTMGVRNSWFLRAYLAQHAAFRVGNVMLKRWGKQCGVNYPRRGYLTSYAVTILWVYYLLRTGAARYVDAQSVPVMPTREQLHVPYMPLWQDDNDDNNNNDNNDNNNDNDDNDNNNNNVDHHNNNDCNGKRHGGKADTHAVRWLGQLLRGFFDFYAHFDWDHEVVTLRRDCSPRCGHRCRRNNNNNNNNNNDDDDNNNNNNNFDDYSNHRSKHNGSLACIDDDANVTRPADLGWVADEADTVKLSHRVYYRICIEDVYEDNLNLGRHLSPWKAAWVKQQFARAAACCTHPSRFAQLLDDCHARAEAVMRVQLHRYLLSCADGTATVAQVRAQLYAHDAALLATYELRNRLSDLWYDEARRRRDAQNALRAGQRPQQQQKQQQQQQQAKQTPQDKDTTATAQTDTLQHLQQHAEEWAVVCTDMDGDDRAGMRGADGDGNGSDEQRDEDDARVVRLVRASVKEVTAATATGATTAAAAASRPRRRERLREALLRCRIAYASLTSQLDADTGRVGRYTNACQHLLRMMFYCVDGVRVFATYDARARFVRHLRQVALALEEPPAVAVMRQSELDSVHDGRAPQQDELHKGKDAHGGGGACHDAGSHTAQQTARRRALATTVLRDTLAGQQLDESIVRSISIDTHYVTYDTRTHTLARTPLLYDHAGHIAVEEEVERVTRSYAPVSTTAAAAVPPMAQRVRRNVHSSRMGVCDECGGKDKRVYATTMPMVDRGWYCMGCWARY